MKTICVFALLSSVLLGGCRIRSVYYQYPITISEDAFVGNWIGFARESSTAYSLKLSSKDGKLLAFYESGRTAAMRLRNLRIKNGQLECDISNSSFTRDPKRFDIKIEKDVLSCVLAFQNGTSESIELRKRAVVENALEKNRTVDE